MVVGMHLYAHMDFGHFWTFLTAALHGCLPFCMLKTKDRRCTCLLLFSVAGKGLLLFSGSSCLYILCNVPSSSRTACTRTVPTLPAHSPPTCLTGSDRPSEAFRGIVSYLPAGEKPWPVRTGGERDL